MNTKYKNKTKFDKSPTALSKTRQNIYFLQKEADQLYNSIMNNNLLLKGVLYQMRHTCGKSNCKCAKSEADKHVNWYLSRSENGKTKVSYVKNANYSLLRKLTEEYRRFRETRHKLVEIYRQLIKSINTIEKIKTRPFWEGKQNEEKRPGKLSSRK